MVTINLTLLVELGLFLVFLWGTQRYILTPILKNIDEREDAIEQNHAEAETNAAESDALEKEYRHEIAVIRRQADEQVRAAHQKSQQEHAAFLIEERAKAEQAIAEVRQEAQKIVDSQRDTIAAEVPDLVKRIEATLNAGGNS